MALITNIHWQIVAIKMSTVSISCRIEICHHYELWPSRLLIADYVFVCEMVCVYTYEGKIKAMYLNYIDFVHRIIIDKNNFILLTFPTEDSSRKMLFKGCFIYCSISQQRNWHNEIYIEWINELINFFHWHLNLGQCHWNKLLFYSENFDCMLGCLILSYIFFICVVENSGILEHLHF